MVMAPTQQHMLMNPPPPYNFKFLKIQIPLPPPPLPHIFTGTGWKEGEDTKGSASHLVVDISKG